LEEYKDSEFNTEEANSAKQDSKKL